MARKRKGFELLADLSGSDKWEAEQLLTIEQLDRAIISEVAAAKDSAAEFKERIDALKETRKQVLDELEKFRLGNRRLPIDDEPATSESEAA